MKSLWSFNLHRHLSIRILLQMFGVELSQQFNRFYVHFNVGDWMIGAENYLLHIVTSSAIVSDNGLFGIVDKVIF